MAGHPPPFVERLFPEVSAGGFTRMDGTVEFYTRVNALLRPDMTVLDFGAGRGAGLVDAPETWASTLAGLIDDPERQAVLGRNARCAYEERYAREHAFAAWAQVLAAESVAATARISVKVGADAYASAPATTRKRTAA